MTRRIVAVTAGLSQPSSSRLLTDRLVRAVGNALSERGEQIEVTVIELREYARDLANNLVSGFPAPRLAAAIEQVTTADGLIVVSPIFSGSYSGLFKTFFDVLDPDALAGTPVLLGATGGTARHSLALEHALRPLMSYLRTITAPTAVFAAPEDWSSEGVLADRLTRAGEELAALVVGSSPRAARSTAGSAPSANGPVGVGTLVDDSVAEVVPFERLLGRNGRG
jgi:FMN reductase